MPVGEAVVLLGEQHAEGQVRDAVPQRQHVIEVAQYRPGMPALLGVVGGPEVRVDDEVVQAFLDWPGEDGHQQLAVLRSPLDIEPVRVR